HVDAIGLSERRNCTGLAIFEKAGELALGGEAKLSIELPVDRAQIYLVRGGYHGHQVAVVILQENALRQLISRDGGGLRGARAVPCVSMRYRAELHVLTGQIVLYRRCNAHGGSPLGLARRDRIQADT